MRHFVFFKVIGEDGMQTGSLRQLMLADSTTCLALGDSGRRLKSKIISVSQCILNVSHAQIHKDGGAADFEGFGQRRSHLTFNVFAHGIQNLLDATWILKAAGL